MRLSTPSAVSAGPACGRYLLALVLAAFVLRAVAVAWLRPWREPVMWENGAIARSIADGHGFSFDYSEGEISNYYTMPRPVPTSFQAPFYPYLLAGFFILGRHLGAHAALILLLLLQAAVGASLVIAVYRIGTWTFGTGAGLLAGAIVAVYPGLVYCAAALHHEVWAVTAFGVVFAAWLALARTPTPGRALACGILCALSLLIEPVFMAFIIALCVGVVAVSERRGRTALAGVAVLAAAFVVIAPWLVRGYLVHGRFVFIKSSGGFNLWQGNNPACNGTPHSGWKHVAYPVEPALLARLKQADDELERDDIWRAAALAAMRADPARAVGLFVKKAVFFWTLTPYHALTRHPSYWLPYALLLVPAVGALISCRKQRRTYLPMLLVFGAATLVYSITFPGPRYRMPVEPLVFIFSAQGLLLAAHSAMHLRWPALMLRREREQA